MRKKKTRRAPPEIEAMAWKAAASFLGQTAALMGRTGVTRAELARRMGVSRTLVSRLFRGETNLTLRSLAAVARALDAEIEVEVRRRRPKLGLPPGIKLELVRARAKSSPQG